MARVELGAEKYDWNALLNKQPTGMIGIYQLPGSNALEIRKARDATQSLTLDDLIAMAIEHSPDLNISRADYAAAGYAANASLAALHQAVSDKIYSVKEAYYTILQAKSLILVNEENVKLSERQLYRARRYFKAGIRTKVDVSDANVKLLSAKLALQKAFYSLKLAHTNLEWVVGLQLPARMYALYQPKLEMDNLYATLQVERAGELYRSVNGGHYPKIYLQGQCTGQHVDKFAANPQQQYSGIVGAEWNLFEGFKTDAKSQEAKANLMRARADYDRIWVGIRQ